MATGSRDSTDVTPGLDTPRVTSPLGETELHRHLASSAFWIVWSRGLVQVTALASTLLVARLLTPSDYGVAALAAFWTSTLALVAEMGLGAAIVQFQGARDAELDACFWTTLGVAAACQTALMAGAPLLAGWFSTPVLAHVIPVASVTVLLSGLRVVPESLLRRHVRLDRISQSEGASAAVAIAVALGLALRGAGVWALVLADVAAGVTRTGLALWFCGWRPRARLGSRPLGPLFRYGLSTLGSALAWSTYSQVDRVILAGFTQPAAVGIYTMAKQLATLPSEKLVPAVNQLTTPLMARLQGSLTDLRMSLIRSIRLVAGLVWPTSVLLAVLADDLVRLFLTPKWLPAVPLLRVLAFHAMAYAVGTLFAPVLMARYRTDLLVRYSVTQLFLLPAAFWIGAQAAGGFGVAVAWTVIYPLPMFWLARRTLAEIALPPRVLLGELGQTLLATAAMALAGLGALQALGHLGPDSGTLRVVAVAPLMAVAYLAVRLAIGGTEIRGEVATLVRWVVGIAPATVSPRSA
jgi:O-antigen/teichoic acid export membrane protein